MKALTQALPDLQRLIPQGHRWFTLWMICVLVALELFGRTAPTVDYHDVLSVVVLISVVSFAVVRHRKDPHPWLSWLESAVDRTMRRLIRLRHEFGIDLRGDPPLPRGIPRTIPAISLAIVALGALFAWGWWIRPDGWRGFVAYVPYTIYLVVIAAVWAGLIGLIVTGVLLPLRIFDGLIEDLAPGSKPAAVSIYLISILFLSLSFPAAVPLVFAGLLLLGCAIAMVLPGSPVPAMVWKGTESQRVSTIPIHRLMAILVGAGTLAGLCVLSAACGGAILVKPDWTGSMPMTTVLGAWAAWFIPGVFGVLTAMIWHAFRTDPARRTPATLHVANTISQADLIKVRSIVSRWGWYLTQSPSKPAKDAVSIRLVPQELSEAREFEPGWPLNVGLSDLTEDIVKDRLVRRDEIQLRRAGFRGLKKLFKRAGLQRGSGGAGVLFAPHWWFIDGLDREEDTVGAGDDDFEFARLRRVGPTFERVLPPRVRQHWHAVLRATQIDLIFLEDGVNWKSFERVLRQILDIYDRHAGKRQAEDHLFRGIPRIKVMIHDYSPGSPFDPGANYPEPKFLELSRARVLHVFKDRGDATELDDVPFDTSWEPVPMGVLS